MSKKKPRRLPYVVLAQWVGDLLCASYWSRYATEERAVEEAKRLLTGDKWKVLRTRVEREPVAPGETRRVVARYVREGADHDAFFDGNVSVVRPDGSVIGE